MSNGRCFLHSKGSKPNADSIFLPMIKFKFSNKNKNFWKICICHRMLDIFSVHKDLSGEVITDINNYSFLIIIR